MKYISDSIGFSELPNITTLNIYTVGCARTCLGCHHEHLKDFNYPKAKTLRSDMFLKKIRDGHPLVKGVVWLGGDPIYQSTRLMYLIDKMKDAGSTLFNCLYTGELFENIDSELKSRFDIIKDGEWKGIPVFDEGTNQRFFIKCELGGWKEVLPKELTLEMKAAKLI